MACGANWMLRPIRRARSESPRCGRANPTPTSASSRPPVTGLPTSHPRSSTGHCWKCWPARGPPEFKIMSDASEIATGPGETLGNAGPGMLDGVRVIEIADERAEYTGLLMSGLGAEVIKIEPPGGNATRRIRAYLADKPGPE